MTDILYRLLWSEWFWFTPGKGWKDFENREGTVRHPLVSELPLGFLAAVILMLVRYALERCVFTRVALAVGLKYSPRAERQAVLDQFYRGQESPSDEEVSALARKVDWSTTRVRRWFRVKRNEKLCPVKKFCECAFRIVHSIGVTSYGLWIIHDEPWAKDAILAIGLDTWPHHHLKTEYLIYYMIDFGFYISLLLNSDTRRKDFREQFVHHVACLALIILSWTANYVQIGLLASLIHKPAEAAIHLAKVLFYLKLFKDTWLETALTIILSLIWIITKLIINPIWIVLPLIVQMYNDWEGSSPCLVVTHSCLTITVFINFIWTYLIAVTIRRRVEGHDWKDARSDDEDDGEKED